MLKPSEVWRRAYHKGRECQKRIFDKKLPGPTGLYNGSVLCAIGFLNEPYEDELRPSLDIQQRRQRLAKLYRVPVAWLEEAESRYEGWNYPRHSLLALAEWAEKQGH